MRRHPGVVGSALALSLAAATGLGALPAPAAAPPVRTVTVTGDGVSTWPAYDEQVARFAIDTSPTTEGRVVVTATTDDPDGTVTVDGRPVAPGEPVEVTGLDDGDEVNVQVSDAGGTTNQSFVALPAGYPRLHAESLGAGPAAGHVFLGISSYLSEAAYESVLDAHGVPVHVAFGDKTQDLKPSGAGDGRYTIARLAPGSTDDDASYQVDELDGRFRTVTSHQLNRVKKLGIKRDDTDFHDSRFLPDGRVLLIGYARDRRPSGRRWLDAVFQIQDERGRTLFTWSSKGRVRPKEGYVRGARGQDYAHLNSVDLQPNGDVVASFRNTGQVLRIATRERGRFQPGDIVWRLGGERNEFTFVDDPLGGFCAQHDARILPDGHLLLFDNGSERRPDGPLHPQTADMCPDPADPDGPRIARPQSRVVEYALDPKARTATLVWSHQVEGRYSAFAANAQRLAGGHTLVNWWNGEDLAHPGTAVPMVTEVDAAGAVTWRLTAQGWFSYRAHKGAAPDRTRPRVTVTSAGPGQPARWTCTDTGGSNLATCTGSVPWGETLPDGPGRLVVTATDRAGNTRARAVTWP